MPRLLAALTPSMLQQSASAAQERHHEHVQLPDQRASRRWCRDTRRRAFPSPIPANNALVRQVTLNYSVQSANNSSAASWDRVRSAFHPRRDRRSRKASIPPNINFYLLLDNSPSMSLPATTDGISLMQTLTYKQYSGAGCAFACHQASTNNSDTIGNPVRTAPCRASNGYMASRKHPMAPRRSTISSWPATTASRCG